MSSSSPLPPDRSAAPNDLPVLGGRFGDWLGELADRLGTSIASLVLGVFGAVVVLAIAVLLLLGSDAAAPELTIPYAPTSGSDPDADATPSTSTAPPAEVLVHAAGAVRHPGVYLVATGARVSDLLAAAGGPTPEADLDRVNLAAPVADGSRVYVPVVGEDHPPSVVAGALGPAGDVATPPGGGNDPGQLVDINRATASELDALPGIGPATAAAIVEHRERNGPFASVDDLLDVSGIGDAKLAALRDLVHV